MLEGSTIATFQIMRCGNEGAFVKGKFLDILDMIPLVLICTVCREWASGGMLWGRWAR
jgi:hypothetical protein